MVNPAQVRAISRKAIGQRAKTGSDRRRRDRPVRRGDAVEPRPLPDEATRLLADLVARRRQIIEMIGAERQREKPVDGPAHSRKSIARLVKALEKELASVDADIDDAVRGSPAWREKEDLLASVPGVGPMICAHAAGRAAGTRYNSTARRSPLSRAWLRSPASPANGEAGASSAAAEALCAPRCSGRDGR